MLSVMLWFNGIITAGLPEAGGGRSAAATLSRLEMEGRDGFPLSPPGADASEGVNRSPWLESSCEFFDR